MQQLTSSSCGSQLTFYLTPKKRQDFENETGLYSEQQLDGWLSGRTSAYLFGRVLLPGGVGAPQPVLHTVPVLQLFDLINPDQPVL